MQSRLTTNERAMLKAAQRVHPKKLALEDPELQDDACRLDGMGLLAVYERGSSSGIIYALLTTEGRAALAREGK